jgi:competence protein ComEA
MKESASTLSFFSEPAMNPFLFASLAPAGSPHISLPFAAARQRRRPVPGARPPARDACPPSWARRVGAAMLGAGACVLALPAEALDVNSATITQLQALRGLGPKTARIIVLERERGGNFESLSDLADRVRGIGERKKQALQAAGLTAGDGMMETGGGAAHAASRLSARPVLVTPAGASDASGGAEARVASAAPLLVVAPAPAAVAASRAAAPKSAAAHAAATAGAARAGAPKITAGKPAPASPKPPGMRRPKPGR